MALQRSFLLLVMALALTLSVEVRSQPEPPPDAPRQATFKTGIDIVQLDVTVLDKDRRPIRGLTIDDFTVLEHGKPQPIVAVVPVELPDAPAASASWIREAPLDVVSNSLETRRLITIMMDDANTGVGYGESTNGRQIANAIVDGLGPNDLAAVVFSYLGKPHTWSADRSRLRTAIDSFLPKMFIGPVAAGGIAPSETLSKTATQNTNPSIAVSGAPVACWTRRGGCLVDALSNVAKVLEAAPAGRKIVMIISSNAGLDVTSDPDKISPLQDVFRVLQRVNATVYAFDPRGLTPASTGKEIDDLRSITGATGGSTFANTNAPESFVSEVYRQNSAYYLVGFRRTETAPDGRFKRVQVKVNRAGATVRTRAGYYAPRANAKAESAPPSAPLDAALTGIVATGDLPVTLNVAAFANAGRREASLTLVANLAMPDDGDDSNRVNVVASVFDLEGRSRGSVRQTLNVTRGSAGAYDVYSRIPDIKPGRYEVRFAVERGGRAGSVFAGVDVPDFSKEDFAVSGVLVERIPRAAAAIPDDWDTVTTVRPTAARTFARGDQVHAFVRLYKKVRQSVRITSRIVNDRGEPVFTRTDTVADDAFTHDSADYQVEIPLSSLQPGAHLLTIDAAVGEKRLTRDVRFVIR